MSYKDAGVDIDAQAEVLNRIRGLLKSTYSKSVLAELGTFGALFSLDKKKFKKPILVSSVDGVGTKLKVAFMTGIHDTIGLDLVNHCVNDIFVQGATPLFFLDYIASGKLNPAVLEKIVKGIARGCKETGCSLIGGETAEMPDFYREGEYDVAGFICGVVEKDSIIDGSTIVEDDLIIGLPSSGLHTNGYSLARKVIFEVAGLKCDSYVEEFGRTVGEELLQPHRCYYNQLKHAVSKGLVKGMAHITGGGLYDNIPRIIPNGVVARIRKGGWYIPPIFSYLQAVGNIADREMYRTFNMGIGMALVIAQDSYDAFEHEMKQVQEKFCLIGEIDKGEKRITIR
ncbi:MAG: phosphoribosylformylglycinamidine cyclo-ligase [Acidobacteriota bacterium]